MKTGQPGHQILSAETVSRDMKRVFVNVRHMKLYILFFCCSLGGQLRRSPLGEPPESPPLTPRKAWPKLDETTVLSRVEILSTKFLAFAQKYELSIQVRKCLPKKRNQQSTARCITKATQISMALWTRATCYTSRSKNPKSEPRESGLKGCDGRTSSHFHLLITFSHKDESLRDFEPEADMFLEELISLESRGCWPSEMCVRCRTKPGVFQCRDCFGREMMCLVVTYP